MNIQKIPNQIIKEPLQYLNLANVDSIALHHMAHPTADVKTVEGWHINQGWRALGYNFWVAFDGTVYEGRGFKLGAGVTNQNGHIISIGFQGDYHSKDVKMPDAQFNAGVDIIKYVLEKVPTVKKIGGHGEFMATACPGQYFPLEEMKTLKKRGELDMTQYEELKNLIVAQNKKIDELEKKIADVIPTYYDKVEDCPHWSKPYVAKAIEIGLLKGDEQGKLRLTDVKIYALVLDLRDEGIME